jgi:N-alpha-acetyltransferase 40
MAVLRSSESSMGWDPSEKQGELFHPDSRFIVLSYASEDPSCDSQEPDNAQRIIGFSMFRFDYEEGEKLLYW